MPLGTAPRVSRRAWPHAPAALLRFSRASHRSARGCSRRRPSIWALWGARVAVGPVPWKRRVPSQALPTRAPAPSSSARPLGAPAAAKNTGQLLCHNLIAALFTRNVNESDPQEERKHSQPTFKGGGLPQKGQFGHFSKSLGIQTPGKQR